MRYALVVLETSISDDTTTRMRLKSVVSKIAESVRSTSGSEVIAENLFLIDLQAGSLPLTNILRVAQDAGLKYKTEFLQDRPSFVSQ